MGQITYLTSMLYSQLGMTEEYFQGLPTKGQCLTIFNRTIEPICSAICGAMKWKFLTKTADPNVNLLCSSEIHSNSYRLRILQKLQTSLLVMKFFHQMMLEES